jgi:hypothetical protein
MFRGTDDNGFILSKRQEMLDKTLIPGPLKETLLFSPLVKDKLFGLRWENFKKKLVKQ